jgi:hypothetical protein
MIPISDQRTVSKGFFVNTVGLVKRFGRGISDARPIDYFDKFNYCVHESGRVRTLKIGRAENMC